MPDPDIDDRVNAAIEKFDNAAGIAHDVANGPAGAYIDSESGPIPSLLEWQAIHADALGDIPTFTPWSREFVAKTTAALARGSLELDLPDAAATLGARTKGGAASTVQAQLAAAERTIDTAEELAVAFPLGGHIRIKDGGRYIPAPGLKCEYTALNTGFLGHGSIRYDIAGETQGNTILSAASDDYDYVVTLRADLFASQRVGGNDRFGNLTIANPSYITTPNTTGVGPGGLLVENKANTEVYSYTAIGLSVGLRCNSVLISSLRDLNIGGCTRGIIHEDTTESSGPNSVKYTRAKVMGSTGAGFRCDIGAALNIDTLDVENSVAMGSTESAIMLIGRTGTIAGVVALPTTYCELNGGLSDLYIEHHATQDCVINVIGAIFARVSPTTFTQANIWVANPGGGRVTVNLIGCTFLSGFGYVPTPARPFWTTDTNCRVVYDDTCVFSERVSLPITREYAEAKTVQFGDDGTFYLGAEGLTCVRESTGVYLVTSNRPLGTDPYSYNLIPALSGTVAHAASTATQIRAQAISETTFRVRTTDSGGTPANSNFTCSIFRIR